MVPTSLKITKEDVKFDGKFPGQQGAPAGPSICPDDDRKDEAEPAQKKQRVMLLERATKHMMNVISKFGKQTCEEYLDLVRGAVLKAIQK